MRRSALSGNCFYSLLPSPSLSLVFRPWLLVLSPRPNSCARHSVSRLGSRVERELSSLSVHVAAPIQEGSHCIPFMTRLSLPSHSAPHRIASRALSLNTAQVPCRASLVPQPLRGHSPFGSMQTASPDPRVVTSQRGWKIQDRPGLSISQPRTLPALTPVRYGLE